MDPVVPAYCHTSVHCASPGESAVEVSVAPSWVEVEQVWFQVACPKGVAETSSAVEHVGCAVNLTGKESSETRQDSIKDRTHRKCPSCEDNSCLNILQFYLQVLLMYIKGEYDGSIHFSATQYSKLM